MTLADRVMAVLDEAHVSHALIGASALAAAGVVRSTLDVDILTLDTNVLDRAFWSALEAADVAVDIRPGEQDDPLRGVVRATALDERPVDVVVGRYAWQQRAIARAQRLPTGQAVVIPRDLVLLKLYAGGTQDLWDIRQLLAATDRTELARQVEEDLHVLSAPAPQLWREALK
jgi:hypothetical protein